MSNAGLLNENLVYRGNLKYEQGIAGINKITESQQVDGVICGCDQMAIGVINALREKGIKVPEDVNVIGFDNIALAAVYHPKLTTVARPLYDMGSVGMRLLIKLINKLPIEESYYRLPYEFVKRDSCK